MIVDISKLEKKIEEYEATKECPNWESCSINLLEAMERVALQRRAIIRDFCALAEKFSDCIVKAED